MATTEYMVASTVGKTLREELVSLVRYVLEDEPDPVTAGIVTNSTRVTSTLGRSVANTDATVDYGFTAQHPLVFGRAGTIKYATQASLGGHQGDYTEPPRLLTTPAYPLATDVPQRRAVWLSVGLKRLMGNLVIDDRQLMALEKGQPVDDFFVEWLKDPAELLRLQLTTDFFGDNTNADSNGCSQAGKVGVVSSISVLNGSDSITLGDNVLITLDSGSLRSFWRGQRLNSIDDTTNDFNGTGTKGVWMVQNVYNYGSTDGTVGTQIQVICVTAPVTAGAALAANDVLVLEGAGTAGMSVSGLGNMLVDPGAGADVTYYGLMIYDHSPSKWLYPELQSYFDVQTTERFPTPLLFAKSMSIMADRGMGMPKRWIMPRSVRDLWFQQEAMFKAYNTNFGPAVQNGADGGYSGNLSITTIDGGKAEVLCSAFCPSGTAYGIDMDAFVRYAPYGTESVKFLGNNRLTGTQSFLMTVNSSGAYTSIYQQPFDYYTEWGCTAPWKLAKIGGLKDVTDVI